MGVLACDRNKCERIMCDYYSSEYGYLCYECLEELSALGVRTDIEAFMHSPKRNENIGDARTYFESIFKTRDTSW